MKKIYLPIVFLVNGLIVFFIARSQNRSPYGDGNPGCIENKNLYEELLEPTRADSLAFVKLDSLKKYPGIPFTGSFNYDDVTYVRGLIDTSLFNPDHYHKFDYMNKNARFFCITSPLIVEGEVMEVLNEDTTKSYLFPTVFIIKIKEVVASKYKVKAGDYVTARTNLYGYVYSSIVKEVNYRDAGISPYKKGKTYLFVFNKNYYRELLYKIQKQPSRYRVADVYCPYSFALNFAEHEISELYANGQLTKQEIKALLKK